MNLSGIADAGFALAQALTASVTDPADQVRLLLEMTGSVPNNPFGHALRRMALTQASVACAAYQPTSYDDALALRELVCGALDAEINAAGDAGDDEVYAAFRALRIAVALDLRTRGDQLPRLRTVTVPVLPPEVLAYRLYGDATRANDLVARSDPSNPLFMPGELVVLDR